MVSFDDPYSGPRPLAASQTGTLCAVAAMSAVVLSMTVVALATILADNPNRWTIIGLCLAGLAGWCVLVSIPALLCHVRRPSIDRDRVIEGLER